MFSFGDVIDWGTEALFGSTVVDDVYDYAYQTKGLVDYATDAYDYVSDFAGDVWDMARDAKGVYDEYSGFLGIMDEDAPAGGRRKLSAEDIAKLAKVQRSAVSPGVSTAGKAPSLQDMGYVDRVVQKANTARGGNNPYVRNNFNMIGANIGLGGQTIDLSSATLPGSNIRSKYVG